jgi:hypothetical protein
MNCPRFQISEVGLREKSDVREHLIAAIACDPGVLVMFFQQRRVLDGGIFDDSLMHGVSVMPLSPEIASFAAHCGLRK